MKIAFYILLTVLFFSTQIAAADPIDHPRIKWKFQSDAPIRGAVATDTERIYFGNSDGTIYCLDKRTAAVVWQFKTGGSVNSQPLVNEGKLIVQSRDNTVYAINTADGSLAWKFLMPRPAPHTWGWDYYDASPVVYGKSVLIGSGDHKLYSLSMETGKQQWAYVTGDKIRATPVVLNDNVVVGSFDGFLHVVQAKTGKLVSKFQTEGVDYYGKVYGWDRTSLVGRPAVAGNMLVIGSRDGGLYGLDVNTLEKKWRFSYGSSWVGSAPAIDGQQVFVGWSDAHVFSAHDMATGNELWKFNGHAYFYANPVVDATNVYAGCFNGHIYAFNKQTGAVTWAYQTGGAVLSSPVLEAGVLYVGSDNGYLYAFENGEETFMAVYDIETENVNELVADKKIKPYLLERGYQSLDSTSLAGFLTSRIADGKRSTVVFAHQYLTRDVAGDNANESLLKRYMDAGGRVVWLGYFPNYWVANRDLKIVNINPKFTEELLEIRFDVNMDFGTYYAAVTDEGKNWGLPQKFTALGSPFASGRNITPLAYNEFGRIAAFYKPFGSKPYAGFVYFRSWSLMPIRETDLEAIRSVAEYGY